MIIIATTAIVIVINIAIIYYCYHLVVGHQEPFEDCSPSKRDLTVFRVSLEEGRSSMGKEIITFCLKGFTEMTMGVSERSRPE